ncbi:HalOD1 output domain-containing protein [Halorussus halophilus]|uniref:HalOD1 output domain-containing protein n=1 Tax=Halorussus halophilus TaxID=2650975 RepID=UPI001CE49622|nr:HalOD1 output domain-containing protein [Halorussus halophilus]
MAPKDQWSVSATVVEQVAAAHGVEPTELDTPLGTTLDTDALDSLVGSLSADATVSFTYTGIEVVVHSDGYVEVSR